MADAFPGMWDRDKSAAKADSASSAATRGAVAGAGPAALVFVLIRHLWPDLLPWGVETDAAIIAAVATLGARLWAWYGTYRADKVKHGG
jgi:hypothetical protein